MRRIRGQLASTDILPQNFPLIVFLCVGAIGVVVSMLVLHAGDRGSSPSHSTNSKSEWCPTVVRIMPKMEVLSQ